MRPPILIFPLVLRLQRHMPLVRGTRRLIFHWYRLLTAVGVLLMSPAACDPLRSPWWRASNTKCKHCRSQAFLLFLMAWTRAGTWNTTDVPKIERMFDACRW